MEDSFKLKNKDGEIFTALRIAGARIDTTRINSSQREYAEGLPSYRLQDGTRLNKLDDMTFKNISTSEILTVVV